MMMTLGVWTKAEGEEVDGMRRETLENADGSWSAARFCCSRVKREATVPPRPREART